MSAEPVTTPPVPPWLRTVMAADRAGTAWYFGASFLFAPVLALISPWPAATTLLWWIIGLTGLYLGLLGIAMTIGLARVLRSGAEIPEDYWRSMIDRQRIREERCACKNTTVTQMWTTPRHSAADRPGFCPVRTPPSDTA